jgi:hypothetical protein
MVMACPTMGCSGVRGPERCEFDDTINVLATTATTVTVRSAAARIREFRRLAAT